ncbi:DUF4238 domain-containing protein [Amycolatopsis alba]|uniref:DUF4238 domain-containing protein n=1 Tax=Amycolatopsis alba TaxID=76020 RepID=UPI0024697F4B|nr:DUF4238 domain-containing protein [Amycolatopsis alba]
MTAGRVWRRRSKRTWAVSRSLQSRASKSKRHHYVPKSYLRAWSFDQRRVRVLNTVDGTDRPVGLRDVCVKENFYRVTDSSGRQHNQVEDMLAVLDEECAKLLRLLRGWAPGDDVDFEDFMSLAVVMAVQRSRTPQARRHMQEMTDGIYRSLNRPTETTRGRRAGSASRCRRPLLSTAIATP